jgi:hypothetical protein
MRKLAGIVESSTPPATNMLWLCGTNIKYFSKGQWVTLGPIPKKQTEKPDLYSEYKKKGGKLKLEDFARELVILVG